jgi:DNA-binding transcriptional LysR family regulator
MIDPAAPADLDTALLRSFVVLAEERHFGQAALRLNVSQPALSKRLRRLEEMVGGPLLVRGYRDVRLTEPGRVLLERARSLLREAGQALEVSREAVRGEAGLLRIGFGVASIAELLPEVLLRFRRAHPRVQIEMRDMSSPAQVEALRRGEIDLGFVRQQPSSEAGIDWLPILRERLVAAVQPRSPWRDRPGLPSLARAPFVACSRAVSASYYDHVVALCRAAGFAPRIVTETNDLFSLLQLVRAGVGVALVPSAAAAMRVPGVRLKKVVEPAAAWDIALARRKQDSGPLVDAFVRVAREVTGAELRYSPPRGP